MIKKIILLMFVIMLTFFTISVIAESFEWTIYADPANVTKSYDREVDQDRKEREYSVDVGKVFVLSSGPNKFKTDESGDVYAKVDVVMTNHENEVYKNRVSLDKERIGETFWRSTPIFNINKIGNISLIDSSHAEHGSGDVTIFARFFFDYSIPYKSSFASVTVKDRVKPLYNSAELSNIRNLVKNDHHLYRLGHDLGKPTAIGSSNSKILMGFSTDPADLTNTGDVAEVHSLTSDYENDVIYVCLDNDENDECDYIFAEDACGDNADFYNFTCCGDSAQVKPDSFDSNLNAFCTEDKNNNPVWIPLEYIGEIFELNNADIVSNGSKFLVCGQKPTNLPATNSTIISDNSFFYVQQGFTRHYYHCYDNEIIECGGNMPYSSSNSKNIGYKLNLAQPIDDSKTYFCADYFWSEGPSALPEGGNWSCNNSFCDYYTSKYNFIRCDSNRRNCDLDCQINPQTKFVTCHMASYVMYPALSWIDDLDYSNTTCYAAGFNFTGTKCCGDKLGEYYDDPWTIAPRSPTPGVCWNSTYIPDGEIFLSGLLLVNKGNKSFCKYITNCSVLIDDVDDGHHSALCTPIGWVKGLRDNLLGLTNKSAAWPADVPSYCCSPTSCWNGTSCVGEDSSVNVDGDFYYCRDADWVLGFSKSDWSNLQQGFCVEDSQCLVNPSFNSSVTDVNAFWTDNKPMCINNASFILDNYCLNGSWTSRTALLASNLYSIGVDSGNSFSVYCDSPENVLLDLNYLVEVDRDDVLVSELFDSCTKNSQEIPCINNICVAKIGNDIILSSSLNIDVDDEDKSFLYVLGFDNDACRGSDFRKCGSNPVWYNSAINSLIYSPTFQISSFFSSNVLDSKFEGIDAYVKQLSNSQDYNYFKKPSFSRVFILKKGDSEIFSFLELNKTSNGINYFGINFKDVSLGNNLCNNVLNNFKGGVCASQNVPNNFYLVGSEFLVSPRWPQSPLPFLTDYWQDLTAKLRLT